MSNSKHILQNLPPAERSQKVVKLDLNNKPIQRAFGIIRDPQEDILQIRAINKDNKLTKRGSLSFISSIYDPIRIISPLILEPRTLEDESRMGQTATREYKAKMNMLRIRTYSHFQRLKYQGGMVS